MPTSLCSHPYGFRAVVSGGDPICEVCAAPAPSQQSAGSQYLDHIRRCPRCTERPYKRCWVGVRLREKARPELAVARPVRDRSQLAPADFDDTGKYADEMAEPLGTWVERRERELRRVERERP